MEPLEVAEKFGALLSLKKPISREQLLDSVRTVLAG
jgi:hypothetical protein